MISFLAKLLAFTGHPQPIDLALLAERTIMERGRRHQISNARAAAFLREAADDIHRRWMALAARWESQDGR